MSDFHSKKIEEALKELNTSPEGLSTEEAQERLRRNGQNKLPDIKKTSLFVRFLSQFKDIMIIILIVAAVVSLVLALVSDHADATELLDSIIIFVIVIINAIMGLVQEMKAENAMESLKKMTQPNAKVIREGKQLDVKTVDLVVGDIVVLEAGDVVPADLMLLESSSLQCDEASLTGESHAAEKEAGVVLQQKTPLGDRRNLCFSSSTVVYGRGLGVVIATGEKAEMGKIASMLNEKKDEKTPLEKSLSKLGGILTILVLVIAVVIFVVDIILKPGETMNSFLTAVAVAVAAIPESLPAVVTIILSLGVSKLAKKNVIIKRLHAVETLGCCEVICSDKTGTITQNKMVVRAVYVDGKIVAPAELKTKQVGVDYLLRCMTLCNDAKRQDNKLIGDPTETALIDFAEGYDYKKSGVEKKFKRLGEIPFDSQRKLMSTANLYEDRVVINTKGAVDEILKRCSHILIDGKKRAITEKDKEQIRAANTDLCYKALRVLGYAISEWGKPTDVKNKINANQIREESLTFIGLTGMMDPPREEVAAALEKCYSAGLKPIMITGDHKDTAYAIAKELKMVKSKKQVVEGAYLDNFSDEELKKEINKFSVFARVSPEHKVRIVKAFRANGKVVAMTGDGVNDAPSIKSANIGIGMGITGTEVTKEVADMILTDDNFATIVVGVEEGRKIFSNIQKTIQFLLGCNIAEVFVIFVFTIAFPDLTILWPVQILFINFISDTLPAIALGVEEAEAEVMKQPPRKSNANIVGGKTGINIIYQGLTQTVLVVAAFLVGNYVFGSSAAGATMAFLVLNMIQLFHMFNVRTTGSIFKSNPFKNKMLWVAFGVGVGFVLLIALVPFLEGLFRLVPLGLYEWLATVGIALAIIPIVELVKLVQKLFEKRKTKQNAANNILTEEEDEIIDQTAIEND